jgi:hypothetical protein
MNVFVPSKALAELVSDDTVQAAMATAVAASKRAAAATAATAPVVRPADQLQAEGAKLAAQVREIHQTILDMAEAKAIEREQKVAYVLHLHAVGQRIADRVFASA